MKKSAIRIDFPINFNPKPSLKWLLLMLFTAAMTGCVGSLEAGDPLIPVGDETQGPGLFSGESGVFQFGGGAQQTVARRQQSTDPALTEETLQRADLRATSDLLDEKIEQLQRQQQELEQLKQEVNKKLKTN